MSRTARPGVRVRMMMYAISEYTTIAATTVPTPSSRVVDSDDAKTLSCSTVLQWFKVKPKPVAAFVSPKTVMNEPVNNAAAGTTTAIAANTAQHNVAKMRH